MSFQAIFLAEKGRKGKKDEKQRKATTDQLGNREGCPYT